MDSKHRSILVMDANQRSALAVTRALGMHYRSAIITTADETHEALASASKYSKAHLQYPSPSQRPEAFLQWVKENCLSGQFDLVMPTTEVTSQLLLMHSGSLPNLPLAFADYDKVMTLANKALLVKAANKAGVTVPKSDFYKNSHELDVNTVNFPVVLKPNLSKIYSPTGWVATTVRILKTKEDLNEVLASDAYLKETPFMLQEYIPGHGAGLFCLYNRGEPTHFFAHNRLREKPPEGGVSVLSEAAPLNDSLKNSAVKLLNSVKWHGVAMVEFRVDANGKAYLMEVNTRFWGSLQLAIDSGVNFPVLLAQQFFNETTGSMLAYNTKQRLRWLMGDLDSLYIYLKRPYTVKQKLVRVLQFLKPRFNHQKHEVNRLNDFKPFIYELKHYFR